MSAISGIDAREVLDSRGHPTVEADVSLEDGTWVSASVPSGASTGRHEAVELRDGDPGRYAGRGVRRAVDNVRNVIAPALRGMPPELSVVDDALLALDGTEDKSRLGANAMLAVSMATARAAASSSGIPLWHLLAGDDPVSLPLPMVNMISGGLHARRQLDFQDFLIMPVSARTYSEALEMCVAVYASTAGVLTAAGMSTLKADEGGFGPAVASHRGALQILQEAVQGAGLTPGQDIVYALDVAATHFFDPVSGRYRLDSEQRSCDADEMAAVMGALVGEFPIVSIEDPLAEDDWDGWVALTERLGSRVQVVGDDLFTTNLDRLDHGIERGAANAVLVKMNQIGTVSETLAVVRRARAAGYRTVISARSGETEDPALADLAVGTAGGQIKVGSVAQSERLAKYNRLLRIEQQLGSSAVFAGRDVLAGWSPVGGLS
jgi:enolase